jgi:hypothetical protein
MLSHPPSVRRAQGRAPPSQNKLRKNFLKRISFEIIRMRRYTDHPRLLANRRGIGPFGNCSRINRSSRNNTSSQLRADGNHDRPTSIRIRDRIIDVTDYAATRGYRENPAVWKQADGLEPDVMAMVSSRLACGRSHFSIT